VTEVAAWVGAVAGPCALLWDFYKWKTAGPRLKLTVSPNMQMIPDPDPDALYIMATVQNQGTAGTTITGMCFATYRSWWTRIRLKPSTQFLVVTPSTTRPVPFKIEVGTEWLGMAIQDKELEQMIGAGNLWCNVYHSWSKRPVQAHVIQNR